jgi:PAS domain-containing protein
LGRPALTIIPSVDAAFREHVSRLVAGQAFTTADDLASRLRTLFPRVVVRASEVSGHDERWYVYRDGVWRSSEEAPWWDEPRTPRLTLTLDGWIEAANAPGRAILGLSADDQLPRFFADFVGPGTSDDAIALFAVVAAGRELSVTVLIRPSSGELIACDLRAWSEGGRVIGALRLADDIPVQPATAPAPLMDLVCQPAEDVLFARYAKEAMSRMPEPTPDGLVLRLRRLYPHARVEPDDATWTVFRDAQGVESVGEHWWRADGLASVRYDGQGRILEANPPAERLLGAQLVGQHWQDLVTPGTTDQVAAVLRLISEVGWAVSRFRMPGRDGYLFEFDSYTEVDGDQFITVMRPRSDQDQGPSQPSADD